MNIQIKDLPSLKNVVIIYENVYTNILKLHLCMSIKLKSVFEVRIGLSLMIFRVRGCHYLLWNRFFSKNSLKTHFFVRTFVNCLCSHTYYWFTNELYWWSKYTGPNSRESSEALIRFAKTHFGGNSSDKLNLNWIQNTALSSLIQEEILHWIVDT